MLAATITSPSDGVVLIRRYIQIFAAALDPDAGGGYHIVMAGSGPNRCGASAGQFVLAGNPVGAMGENFASVAPIEVGGAPLLYIEFRKDGKPADPAPWWSGAAF